MYHSLRQSIFAGVILLAAAMPGRVGAQELFEGSGVDVREIEQIYVKGLKWLKDNQQADGSFGNAGRDHYGTQPGVVGLAVVAMLAHGDDPNFGLYSKQVNKGLQFVINQQNKATGYIGSSMYNHGFAALALAEAYGTVLYPTPAKPDAELGKALTNAVQCILRSQAVSKGAQYQGGWRYSPESNDSDSTVSGACFVALLAAANAGIAVPQKSINEGLGFFKACQSSDGGIGYTSPGGPNAPRTAIGGLAFALAKRKDDNAYKQAMQYLYNHQNDGSESHYYHYYLYYASQAYFHGSDAAAWRTWNKNNIATLKETQKEDGSWDGNFGATFATAASLLSMALNYRYLPIYER